MQRHGAIIVPLLKRLLATNGCRWLPSLSQVQATGQSPVHSALGHTSVAKGLVFGASTIFRWAWWLLAVHQPKSMPFDCRSNLPAFPWNGCPPSRGTGAHHPVESMPAIIWNTHGSAREFEATGRVFPWPASRLHDAVHGYHGTNGDFSHNPSLRSDHTGEAALNLPQCGSQHRAVSKLNLVSGHAFLMCINRVKNRQIITQSAAGAFSTRL